jgi:hypothetical protein
MGASDWRQLFTRRYPAFPHTSPAKVFDYVPPQHLLEVECMACVGTTQLTSNC